MVRTSVDGPTRRLGSSGFTLIEVLISLATSLAVVAGALVVFQQAGKMSRNETWVADMQDALAEIARLDVVRPEYALIRIEPDAAAFA